MRCRKILHRFYVLNIRIHPYLYAKIRILFRSIRIYPYLCAIMDIKKQEVSP